MLFEVLNAGLVVMVVIVGGLALVRLPASDRLALAASGAKDYVERGPAPALHDMIERLCAMADLPKPRYAMIDTDVPNAFATGRSPKRAAVAVTTGLWERLEPEEAERPRARALAHRQPGRARDDARQLLRHARGDASRFGMYGGMFSGGRRDNDGGVPVWLIVLAVSIVTYVLSFLLIRAISRYREYTADRGAALITGAPEHLMSALQKITGEMMRSPQRDLRQVEAMNAFFIIPTNVGRKVWDCSPRTRQPRSAWPASPRSPARWAARSRNRVGLRDILSGRDQLKQAAPDRLFALSTARVTLEVELGLKSAGAAAVCFKPLSAGEFVQAEETEMQELLDVAARDSASKVGRQEDTFG